MATLSARSIFRSIAIAAGVLTGACGRIGFAPLGDGDAAPDAFDGDGVSSDGASGDGASGEDASADGAMPFVPEPALMVAAGAGHSCALLASRRVACWGDNTEGQLGDGSQIPRSTPTYVEGLVDASAIVAGGAHTCAVRSASTVACWGSNSDGQLGSAAGQRALTPVAVPGLVDILNISAGRAHSCARSVLGGAASCWGANGAGQLGDGTTASTPTPAPVSGAQNFLELAAGGDFSCGRLSGNTSTFCWGAGAEGQLGDGAGTDSPVPVAVSGLTDAAGLALGARHACARRVNGALVCWGSGGSGAAGSFTDQLVPNSITGVGTVDVIGAGETFSCLFTSNGSAGCWGDNSSGQLATGGQGGSSSGPMGGNGLVDITAYAGGQGHMCALDTSGAVWCWGANGFGQLGDGTTTLRRLPVQVWQP